MHEYKRNVILWYMVKHISIVIYFIIQFVYRFSRLSRMIDVFIGYCFNSMIYHQTQFKKYTIDVYCVSYCWTKVWIPKINDHISYDRSRLRCNYNNVSIKLIAYQTRICIQQKTSLRTERLYKTESRLCSYFGGSSFNRSLSAGGLPGLAWVACL